MSKQVIRVRSLAFIVLISGSLVLFTLIARQQWSREVLLVTGNPQNTPLVSLFVRMSGKLPKHRTRFYCSFFKTTVLYWPPSFGKIVVVFDEESEEDHKFEEILKRHTKQHFPHHKLEVGYEPLPKDRSVLEFPGSLKSPGYNRQLWSSFFIDLYTDDPVIGWMDTDSSFATPVTKSTIFNGTKVRILGCECSMSIGWVQSWAHVTEMALGYPMVADFMTYFPVYLYRDTFTHCREHILKRFNTNNFEEAFKKFYHTGTGYISPVSVVISYAWFFERERYDWNMKVCSDLETYNKRFSSEHKIKPEHIKNVLSEPQTAYHAEVVQDNIFAALIPISYCLTQAEAGHKPAMCSKHSSSQIDDLLILFNPDTQRVAKGQTQCTGELKNYCLNILSNHHKEVGLEIKRNERRMDWEDIETVDKLASEVGVSCPPNPV